MTIRVAGPCTIGIGASENNLSTTKNGVIIRGSSTWQPVTGDKTGAAPGAFIFTGKSCIVELTLTDSTTAKGLRLMASQIADGLLGISSADDAVTAFPKVSIGTLASEIAQVLTIVERDGTSKWIANKAVLLETGELALQSTSNLILPLTILILRDSDGNLFTSYPTYT